MELIKQDCRIYYNNAFPGIYGLLNDCTRLYPRFWHWYANVVLPGIQDRSRSIILCRDRHLCVGIAILKNYPNEKKICTIKIHPEYRDMGFGRQLFERCFEILGTSAPLISVSKERLPILLPILEYHGFQLEQSLLGYYRCNSIEYVFNGVLEKQAAGNFAYQSLVNYKPEEGHLNIKELQFANVVFSR